MAFAVLLACGWAIYLPMFLNPDEDSHYDYALSLFSTGRAMSPSLAVVGRDTNPVVEYLMRESHVRQQRLDVTVGVEPGYGTMEYFRNLDKNAPKLRYGQWPDPAPYISRLYPIGYYALIATAITATDRIFRHSVVADFFTARLCSVALLAPTLWFTWLTLIELRIGRRRAKLIFAAVALLPLTAWMASSVQPDVLVCALVAPITYVALRLRRDPTNARLLIVIGILFALLIATKRHYFLALYLPVLLMLVVRLKWKREPFIAALSLAYSVAPAVAAYWITESLLRTTHPTSGICQGLSPLSSALQEGPGAVLQLFSLGAQRTVRTTFLDEAGLSFWLNYSAYINSTIEIFSKPLTLALSSIIPALSVLIAILFLMRIVLVAKRLISIARLRSWGTAARVATSNVVLNSLITFIVIVYGFEISIGGAINLQGRYWLPFLPAVWLVTFYVAPRALPVRLRAPATNIAVAFVLGFGILASAYTFPSLRERFYERHTAPPPNEEITSAIWADVTRGYLNINGVAYDLRFAAPVERVILEVDGRRRFVTTSFDRPDVQCDMEKTLLHVGYRARLPTYAFNSGEHTLEVLVATPWHAGLIDTGKSLRFTI